MVSTVTYPAGSHGTQQASALPGQLSHIHITPTANLDTPGYEQSRRQISSVVVAEEVLGPLPEVHKTTYIEVPVIEEVIEYVPKKCIVEVEKIVPKYEVERVERIIEVPEIEYVDQPVTKLIEHEPGTPLIEEIETEVIKTELKIEYRQTEKIVEIQGDVIEVPVLKRDAAQLDDPSFQRDKEVPVVVAQTVRPVLTEVYDSKEVADVYAYKPKVCPVDVLVAKPVPSQLIVVGPVGKEHKRVDVPAPQFNTIMKELNQHLSLEDQASLPFEVDNSCGSVTFLHPSHAPAVVVEPDLDLAQFKLKPEEQQQTKTYTSDGKSGDYSSYMAAETGSHRRKSTEAPARYISADKRYTSGDIYGTAQQKLPPQTGSQYAPVDYRYATATESQQRYQSGEMVRPRQITGTIQKDGSTSFEMAQPAASIYDTRQTSRMVSIGQMPVGETGRQSTVGMGQSGQLDQRYVTGQSQVSYTQPQEPYYPYKEGETSQHFLGPDGLPVDMSKEGQSGSYVKPTVKGTIFKKRLGCAC